MDLHLYNIDLNIGIISGVNNSRCPSSDGVITGSNVLNAAQTLSTCIQQMGNATPAPDPLTAGVINTWLDTHLPVSDKNPI